MTKTTGPDVLRRVLAAAGIGGGGSGLRTGVRAPVRRLSAMLSAAGAGGAGRRGRAVLLALAAVPGRRPGPLAPPTMRRAVLLALAAVLVVLCAAPPPAGAQPEPVDEFVPIDELPDEDRLPAAPFLIAAYSIVWLLAFGYFWLLSRRQAEVERDLADLARRRPVPDDDDPLEAA